MRVRPGTLHETFGKEILFSSAMLHLGVGGGLLDLSLERIHLEKTAGKEKHGDRERPISVTVLALEFRQYFPYYCSSDFSIT